MEPPITADEIRKAAAAVLDGLVLPGWELEQSWRTLCALTGRHTEPFLSWPKRYQAGSFDDTSTPQR